jgi:hypothetical protein
MTTPQPLDHPETFLLKRMIGYKGSGYSTFGQLYSRHVEDISKIMIEYAELAIIRAVSILANGDGVELSNGRRIELTKKPNRKTKLI